MISLRSRLQGQRWFFVTSEATERISWQEVLHLSQRLASEIEAANFAPNLLIAIARGGWIPTRLLSGPLSVPKIASIGVTYADAARSELAVYSFPEPITQHHRVLLVEDVLETGRSLVHATQLLRERGAEVRTCCYFYSDRSIVVPDYSLGRIATIPRFPWEVKRSAP
jgi:hypothetical protein